MGIVITRSLVGNFFIFVAVVRDSGFEGSSVLGINLLLGSLLLFERPFVLVLLDPPAALDIELPFTCLLTVEEAMEESPCLNRVEVPPAPNVKVFATELVVLDYRYDYESWLCAVIQLCRDGGLLGVAECGVVVFDE